MGPLVVRPSVVLFVNEPEVPAMDAVTVPIDAVALAVKVSVLVVVAGFGEKEAVTPLDRPDAERLTLPLNPFAGFTVTVLVPLLPCTTPTSFGEDESVKDCTGLTLEPDPPQLLRVNARQAAEANCSPCFRRSMRSFLHRQSLILGEHLYLDATRLFAGWPCPHRGARPFQSGELHGL
jgi:hypothetical protein